jgi:hypothetical protein
VHAGNTREWPARRVRITCCTRVQGCHSPLCSCSLASSYNFRLRYVQMATSGSPYSLVTLAGTGGGASADGTGTTTASFAYLKQLAVDALRGECYTTRQ